MCVVSQLIITSLIVEIEVSFLFILELRLFTHLAELQVHHQVSDTLTMAMVCPLAFVAPFEKSSSHWLDLHFQLTYN